jgi:metallo-beta-lactamase family protein
MASPVTLTFHGAAGTVTGSSYLLETPRGRLLVDCGMFQGPKTLKELNYQAFPFAPGEIQAVLLTHAHIDHSGLLPKLVKQGFAGRIHTTAATADLLTWMLPDSAFIQEGEVELLNRRNTRRGYAPVDPIYSAADAERTLKQIAPVTYGQWIEPLPGVKARWWNAGHILGSGSIELEVATENPEQPRLGMLFSGDLGPKHTALQDTAEAPGGLDYVICESTYGDRTREELDDAARRRVLGAEIKQGLAAGGNVIVPAFAIERSQELLYDLLVLMADGTLPRTPVFLDSPLAIRATEVFERHARELGLDRLPGGDGSPFRAPNIHFVTTAEHSMQLARVTSGAIIVAASGMCDAGRIRHHLKNNLWRPQATVLLIGYQAPGTLGQLLESGAERVRIHGDEISVKARIRRLEIYSGHADRRDLLAWVKARLPVKKALFLTHGEPAALDAMRYGAIELGLDPERVVAPALDQRFLVDRREGPLAMAAGRPRLAEAGIEAARSGWDWHNDLSAFVLALRQRLAAMPGDKARQTLLRELRRTIGGR